MCPLEAVAARSSIARRCVRPGNAHLTRPLCLFAALRPLWLVNDDVLSQQTISLLNTSFSLLTSPLPRSQVQPSPRPCLQVRLVASTYSQFGKCVSTLCRKCNGTNAAGINVGTNVGTWGRSLSGYFPRDDFGTHP